MAALDAAAPCCLKFADLPYFKIDSLPFDQYFKIDETSPVLSESGSKSFALGLELPAGPAAKRLDFLSIATTDWIDTGGFFSPEVIALDEAFNELVRQDDFLYDADEDTNLQVGGIKGQVTLPSNARYLVFRTNEERLAARSAYLWNGSRTFSLENYDYYETAIANPPGVYGYVVVHPHLPVGRIWISVSSP